MKKVLKSLRYPHIALFFCFVLTIATLSLQLKLKNDLDKLMRDESAHTSCESSADMGFLESSQEEITSEPFDAASEETTGVTHETLRAATEKVTATKSADNTQTKAFDYTKKEETEAATEKEPTIDSALILNKKSKKIHSSGCSYVSNMNEENKSEIKGGELESYVNDGYEICSKCKCLKK